MATIIKRNNKWQVRIRKNNSNQISKTFLKKSIALKWAREIENKIEKNFFEDLSQANSITLGKMLKEYLANVTKNKKSWKSEGYKINKLCKHEISKVSLAKLNPSIILKFRDELCGYLNPSTVNKYIILINVTIKYARHILGIYLPTNPCEFIKRLREPEFKGEVIEPDEEKVLLEKAEHSKAKWLKLVIMLGLDCGIRRGEILKIRREDIDFNKHTVILRETKNGLSRRVGVSKRAMDEINKLPININGKLINCERGDTIDFYWQQLKKWTGINKRFHSTRHTFATRASMNGWSITEISAQGGWKDLKVLKRYTHISAEHLAKKLRYSESK
ncbi:tyrosine-type recombinase/integrase [Candidatus Pelagibacter sp. HIMB1611]|uniref:tyrosine-type recombinase/integrase n=1 Tax=Candidatus Pelagibacter sp. HIMB1611 TaxID=3413357 RepID=UPI003F84E983